MQCCALNEVLLVMGRVPNALNSKGEEAQTKGPGEPSSAEEEDAKKQRLKVRTLRRKEESCSDAKSHRAQKTEHLPFFFWFAASKLRAKLRGFRGCPFQFPVQTNPTATLWMCDSATHIRQRL